MNWDNVGDQTALETAFTNLCSDANGSYGPGDHVGKPGRITSTENLPRQVELIIAIEQIRGCTNVTSNRITADIRFDYDRNVTTAI